MPAIEKRVSVKMSIPRDVLTEVGDVANRENRSIEDELAILVENGLDMTRSAGECFRQLSDDYRARLASEGTLNDPPEKVWEEIRRIREEVAHELYPD